MGKYHFYDSCSCRTSVCSNGIAIALPVAVAGQVLTVFARTATIFFQHAADKYAEDANFKMLDICHVAALVTGTS
ncbi:MAG: PTS sugar transporter subunit IIC [Anaerostipes hadrus]